jgi:hypothetical protein
MAESKCQTDASDASMAALPALMLILSDSSAPTCSDKAVTTIEAMELNDNEPQSRRGSDYSDTDTHIDVWQNPPRDSGGVYRVNLKCLSLDLQEKTQRDFDQELILHSLDEQSLEKDCIFVSNTPFRHGDTGRYFNTAGTSTLAHVVAEARDDVAGVWDDFLASLEEQDAIICNRGLPEPTDPLRILRPGDFPMPPPRRFYHRVWRSFGRRLFGLEQEV